MLSSMNGNIPSGSSAEVKVAWAQLLDREVPRVWMFELAARVFADDTIPAGNFSRASEASGASRFRSQPSESVTDVQAELFTERLVSTRIWCRGELVLFAGDFDGIEHWRT